MRVLLINGCDQELEGYKLLNKALKNSPRLSILQCNTTNKKVCDFVTRFIILLLDKINVSDVVSVKIKMASNLLLSTQFCEIIFEIIFRDPLQCFVIEENRSCFIL